MAAYISVEGFPPASLFFFCAPLSSASEIVNPRKFVYAHFCVYGLYVGMCAVCVLCTITMPIIRILLGFLVGIYENAIVTRGRPFSMPAAKCLNGQPHYT